MSSSPRIAVVTQARTRSTRLPGKILLTVGLFVVVGVSFAIGKDGRESAKVIALFAVLVAAIPLCFRNTPLSCIKGIHPLCCATLTEAKPILACMVVQRVA